MKTNKELSFTLPEKLIYGDVKTACGHLFFLNIKSNKKMFYYGYNVRNAAS